MIEQDNLHKAGISQESIMKRESSKAVTQTKAEQEKLLEKVKAYAKRSDPEISENNMDFSKPVDDASN